MTESVVVGGVTVALWLDLVSALVALVLIACALTLVVHVLARLVRWVLNEDARTRRARELIDSARGREHVLPPHGASDVLPPDDLPPDDPPLT